MERAFHVGGSSSSSATTKRRPSTPSERMPDKHAKLDSAQPMERERERERDDDDDDDAEVRTSGHGAPLGGQPALVNRATAFSVKPLLLNRAELVDRAALVDRTAPFVVEPALVNWNMPLAFVNRDAEVVDLLFTCLINEAILAKDRDTLRRVPVSFQPAGMGKTDLGHHVIDVLRRPREATAAAEEAVAKHIVLARCWMGNVSGANGCITAAQQDPRDENLVVRTLLAMFPRQAATLLRLKASTPVVCRMRDLPFPNRGVSFGAALAYVITCGAAGTDPTGQGALEHYLATTPVSYQSPRTALTALIKQRGPLLLLLDNIDEVVNCYDGRVLKKGMPATRAMYEAMSTLSLTLQGLQSVRGNFTYCTARVLSREMYAVCGDSGNLLPCEVVLQPLSAADVCAALQLTLTSANRVLANDMGVVPAMLEHFAHRIVRATGGIGRLVQFALRARQGSSDAGGDILDTEAAIDAAVDALLEPVGQLPGSGLSVNWDGPAVKAYGIAPALHNNEREKVRLVHLLVWTLLLRMPFCPSFEVGVVGWSGDGNDLSGVRLTDVAHVFGLMYAPAPVGEPAMLFHLVAGEWFARSLLTDPVFAKSPATLATAVLLHATKKIDWGSMRGRPLDLVCVNALCASSFQRAGSLLQDLLPHLALSMVATERVPRLSVVVVPTVTATQTAQLDAATKAAACTSPGGAWPGGSTLHPSDLPWLLAEWLSVGTVAVPADSRGGSSQDWFVRLEHGVLGVANKDAGRDNATDWAALRDELSKAPRLGAGLTYTLVVWSLNLAPALRSALGNATSGVYGEGAWFLQDGRVVQTYQATVEEPVFVVPAGVDLVVGNPHAASGGGGGGGALAELLGASVMRVVAAHLPLPAVAASTSFYDAVQAENAFLAKLVSALHST